jgi:hypothetical protein
MKENTIEEKGHTKGVTLYDLMGIGCFVFAVPLAQLHLRNTFLKKHQISDSKI